MNYWKSVKATFVNWFNENKTLASVLIGAIGFPIAVFIVGGSIALIISLLSFLLGEFYASVAFLFMVVGGIGGYLWSSNK
jgi:hypothetical protein